MVAPIITKGAAFIGKAIVYTGSSVLALLGIEAITDDEPGIEEITGALLAQINERQQKAFMIMDFEGGSGYLVLGMIFFMMIVLCTGACHCFNCTPAARSRLEAEYSRAKAHRELLHMLASRSRRTSVNNVLVKNVQPPQPSTSGNKDADSASIILPAVHTSCVGMESGDKRRESTVIPLEEGGSVV